MLDEEVVLVDVFTPPREDFLAPKAVRLKAGHYRCLTACSI